MANQVSSPPHLPRVLLPSPRLKRQPDTVQRAWTLVGGAMPPRCRRTKELAGSGDGLPPRASWRQQAVQEALLAGLLTTLLTSSVLAAPEVFRQSPATTLDQLTTSGLITGQPSSPGLLLDCP